jgi:hypothetical protein
MRQELTVDLWQAEVKSNLRFQSEVNGGPSFFGGRIRLSCPEKRALRGLHTPYFLRMAYGLVMLPLKLRLQVLISLLLLDGIFGFSAFSLLHLLGAVPRHQQWSRARRKRTLASAWPFLSTGVLSVSRSLKRRARLTRSSHVDFDAVSITASMDESGTTATSSPE